MAAGILSCFGHGFALYEPPFPNAKIAPVNRSARSTSPLQLYRRPLGLAAAILLLCGASRVALSLAWGERIPEGGWGFILLQGLRFDLILVGILLGPVAVLRPLLQLGEPGRDLVSRWGARLLSAWAGVAAVFVILLEGSTAPFIGEYGTRPNYLYVEYLQYPREVLSMLSGTHLVALIGVWAVALTGGWLAARYLRRDPAWSLQVRPSQCAWLVPLALVLTVGLVRSTLDHRPVNPSTAVFTGDSLVNQLPLNSPYSLLYALYEHRRDGVGGEIPYGHLDDGVIERIVLREAGLRHGQAARARPIPSLRHQQPTRELEQPLNFVIILMESVGADHVGSLGGKD